MDGRDKPGDDGVSESAMKLEYALRIERLPDIEGGGYVATVPDLPGCMSNSGNLPKKR